MGLIASKLKRMYDLFSNKPCRILLLGLDAAGKTTILYKIKVGEAVHTIPTVGFNVETFQYKNIEFTAWDVGGQEKLRPLWKHYYHNTDAVIFVVDSADTYRIQEAAEELHKMFAQDELRDASLLVFANKQDHPHCMNTAEMEEKLGLRSFNQKPWLIQPSCGVSGNGVYEGIDWLVNILNSKK